MSATHTREEFLICVLGRELTGCRHIAVGSAASLHGAGALLAAELTEPRARVTILGSASNNFFSDGGRELFDAAIQGRLDGFVLGGGQIDGEANINFLGRGAYPKLTVRWPGNFGSPVMYSVVKRVVLLREEHSPRVLVPRVDFISAAGKPPPGAYRPGGPSALITGKCVFSFDRATHHFALKSLHPGVALDELRAATGFDFPAAVNPAITAVPTSRELEILRRTVAPRIARTYPEFAATAFGKAA
jgi:glutaconate CoA-transferase, subunit B